VKALLVRLSSIGDVVHTLPALAALTRAGWECSWLAEPAARPLLDGHPLLRHVVALPARRGFSPRAAARAFSHLRRQRFDAAIDFQGLWKSAAWARLSGAQRVVGYASRWRREPASALLLGERADPAGLPGHVIDKNLWLLHALGIEAVGTREFPLPPTAAEAALVDRELRAGGGRSGNGNGNLALLNPGGGWPNKLWPPEAYAELARGLAARGLRCLVTWGPGEETLADRLAAASHGAAQRCFPTTLLEYVELARRARLVVAADTGTLHLACAVGTPVVGLYGPTDPARNGPFSPDDEVVRRAPACAPCHKRSCTVHDGIMGTVPVEDVLAAAQRRLARAGGGRG